MPSQQCTLVQESEKLTVYVFCNPAFWMVVACSFTAILSMSLICFVHKSLKRYLKRLEFASWKVEQLAERIRLQEPNSLLIEQITMKLNAFRAEEARFFAPKPEEGKVSENKDFHSIVQKQRDDDEAKALKDAKLETISKNKTDKNSAENSSIFNVTKAMLQETKEMLIMGSGTGDPRLDKPSAELA